MSMPSGSAYFFFYLIYFINIFSITSEDKTINKTRNQILDFRICQFLWCKISHQRCFRVVKAEQGEMSPVWIESCSIRRGTQQRELTFLSTSCVPGGRLKAPGLSLFHPAKLLPTKSAWPLLFTSGNLNEVERGELMWGQTAGGGGLIIL